MKVFVTKDEMQLAVLAYFGLPNTTEVELEGTEPEDIAEEIVEAEVEEVASIKPRKRRRRNKQNQNAVTSNESRQEFPEVSPQVESEGQVNDAAFNEYPIVDGFEVQSESSDDKKETDAPRDNDERTKIPESVVNPSEDYHKVNRMFQETETTHVANFESLFEIEEEHEEEPLIVNNGGNDVKLFEEVIAETPEEDELPVNETPSLFL